MVKEYEMNTSINKIGKAIQVDLKIILYLCHSWSTHSKSKNFPAMFALALPNSDFYELTYACKKCYETGIFYFYEFERLEIISLSKTKTEASIRGTIILNMAGVDINYSGKFISACCKEKTSMDWMLNDIEIEWQ